MEEVSKPPSAAQFLWKWMKAGLMFGLRNEAAVFVAYTAWTRAGVPLGARLRLAFLKLGDLVL